MVRRLPHTDIRKAKSRSQPIHYAWDRVKDPEGLYGHCYNVDAFFKGSGSVNVFLNTLIFVLVRPFIQPPSPMPSVRTS